MIVEEINSSLISLILSVVAIWISMRTLRRQTKVDLFEKKFEIFNLLNENLELLKTMHKGFVLKLIPVIYERSSPFLLFAGTKMPDISRIKNTEENENQMFMRLVHIHSAEIKSLEQSKYLFGIKAYKKLKEFITLYKEYHGVLINRNLAEFKIKSEEIIKLVESEDFKNSVLIMEKKLSIFWLKGVPKKEK